MPTDYTEQARRLAARACSGSWAEGQVEHEVAAALSAAHEAGRAEGLRKAAVIARVPQGHFQIGHKELPWWNGTVIAEAIEREAGKEQW